MTTIQFRIPIIVDLMFVWPVLLYRKYKYGFSFRRIYLGEGEYTLVDADVYYKIKDFKWFLTGKDHRFYAARSFKDGSGRTKIISLHREIMNAPVGLLVDHRNNNTLDNRLANLRLATHSQNMFNRKKTKSNTSSIFVGASRRKDTGKYDAKIQYQGNSIYLGTYVREIDAARAYDMAALKYFGEFARLNFPREDYMRVGDDYKYAGKPCVVKKKRASRIARPFLWFHRRCVISALR